MYRVHAGLILFILVVSTVGFAQQTSTSATGSEPAASASTNPNTSVPPSERVVMKVGDTKITQAQFEDMYGDFLKDQAGAPVPKKKTTAENLAGSLMLAKEAEVQGLNKKPEVQRQLEMNRIQVLSTAEYNELQDKAKPTMQQVDEYYKSHLDDFDTVSIRRVFIFKQNEHTNGHGVPAAEANVRADQIRKILTSGGDPKPLIKDTKDAIDAEPLWFRRDELPAVMSQAFTMKVGEWSQVADTPDALIMFEVVKKDRLTLGQATPDIEKKLQAQKLREEMDALKKKTGVWLDEEYFAAPVAAVKTQAPSPSDEKREQQK
jgi:parvulin-like peptidyl-prolyl isomerase